MCVFFKKITSSTFNVLFRVKSIICLTAPAHQLITEGLATPRGEDYANRNQLSRKWANPILPKGLNLREKGRQLRYVCRRDSELVPAVIWSTEPLLAPEPGLSERGPGLHFPDTQRGKERELGSGQRNSLLHYLLLE